MIIDCDSHFMPKDAFDYMRGDLSTKKPFLKFSDDGLLADVEFPGAPPEVPGTTPLPAPGSGASMKGLCDIEVRMADYEKLGITQHFVLPQFSGWWSYLVEPELACAIARSYNLSILRLMREYPGRIMGVALVALQDVRGATQELEWSKDRGFKAAVLDKVYPVKDHPYSETLGSRRELWPFYKRLRSLRCLYSYTTCSTDTGSAISCFSKWTD
jgi:predicted TIM-barrel fold metal-dependent hydrolase